jgi:hypothetical protein
MNIFYSLVGCIGFVVGVLYSAQFGGLVILVGLCTIWGFAPPASDLDVRKPKASPPNRGGHSSDFTNQN